MPAGIALSYIVYIALSYLLAQCGFNTMLLSTGFHVVFFIIYCAVYYRDFDKSVKALRSSWSLFAYMILTTGFSYIEESAGGLNNIPMMATLVVTSTVIYYFLINQKGYNLKAQAE